MNCVKFACAQDVSRSRRQVCSARPHFTPAAMPSAMRALGYRSFITGESASFWHRPSLMARIITPSSRNITCTGGFSLLACTLARMSDEVPEADAAEQLRPAADPDVFDDDVFEDPDRRGAPLESNESDWHEQHLIVEDPDPDEIR